MLANDIVIGNCKPPYIKDKNYNKFMSNCSIVCQGGGAKGAWQAGVLYKLYEDKINSITFFGTSVGALNSTLCYTGQYDLLKYIWWEKPQKDIFKNRFIVPPWKNYKKLYKIIDSHIDNAKIKDAISLGRNLYIRVSNLNTGLSELKMYDKSNFDNQIAETLKASSALYPYFPIVRIDDTDYIDGGLLTNCPVQLLDKIGIIDSIIISPTRSFNFSNKYSLTGIIKRMVEMLLFSQLIGDLKLIQCKIKNFNATCPSPQLLKTVYFINPSAELSNETIKISEKSPQRDFELGMKDAEVFLKDPSRYDVETMMFP